jgi:hypothetical protein
MNPKDECLRELYYNVSGNKITISDVSSGNNSCFYSGEHMTLKHKPPYDDEDQSELDFKLVNLYDEFDRRAEDLLRKYVDLRSEFFNSTATLEAVIAEQKKQIKLLETKLDNLISIKGKEYMYNPL